VSHAPGASAKKYSIWPNVSVRTAKYTPDRRIERKPMGQASSVATIAPTATMTIGDPIPGIVTVTPSPGTVTAASEAISAAP